MAVSISRAHIHGQPVQGEESRGLSDLSLLKLSAAAKSLQSCLTLCNPIDGSPPGSPIPGILQARILEWVAICFSNAWKWKMKVKSLSHVRLLATTWTAAHQAPPSMGFSRQEYWSGVPLPSLLKLSEWSLFHQYNWMLCLWITNGFSNISCNLVSIYYPKGLPKWHGGKESAYQCKRCRGYQFDPWVRKIPWSRKQQPTPAFLPEKSHRQRSLLGYSPRGCN